MTKLYISTLLSTLLLLSACGESTSSTQSVPVSQAQTSNTIQVVRGPVLGAIVKDASGKIAKDLQDGNGTYSFTSTITYPVTARGGVIDIDRDGIISAGDVKNDLNLSTNSGNVMTMLTTYASNVDTKAMLEKIAQDFNINFNELESKTPLNSKEVEAISNIIYKYAQNDNISNNTTDEIEKEIKEEYARYGVSHDSKQTEKELMDLLFNENKVNILSDNEVETEKADLENEYKNELNKYERENGDSEYEYDGSYASHNQGNNCLKCHSAGGLAVENDDDGEADENIFTSGATIFTKLDAQSNDATRYANAYTIRLVLQNINTQVNYSQGRGTGNSYTTFNTGTVNSYTAEVINSQGTVVNKSLVNSHNITRLDCNTCHTAIGKNGAPGRIVSFNYYTTPEPGTTTTPEQTTLIKKSFASDVLPILNAKCASCHGSSGNFTITNSSTPYTGVLLFTTPNNASSSSLLQKASASVSHGGGVVILATSSEYATLRDWILEGAINN